PNLTGSLTSGEARTTRRLVRRGRVLEHAHADLDDARVELGSGRFLEPPQRLLRIERLPVGAIGRHRVERVAGEDDPRLERDLLAGLAVGIPVAVPALVARAHDPADVL